MFKSRASFSARRDRRRRLRSTRVSFPRRKLALQFFLIIILVLFSPLFSVRGSSYAEMTGELVAGSLLMIDSPTFTLDALVTTQDGFLIKSAGTVVETDRGDLADIIPYTVESGDMLSSIARRFDVSMDTIIWENNITDPHRLKPGTTLAILPVSGITHTVQSGDTLAKVAKKYSLNIEQLARQNQLSEDVQLTASTKLIIPGGKRVIATNSTWVASRSPGTYASYKPPTAIDGAVIIANGAKNKDSKWMVKPAAGEYTTYFGARRGHWAVDIADASRPTVSAAAAGTVVKSQCGWNGGYGCVIVIDHGDGFQTLYAHLGEVAVAVGDPVQQGGTIGQMGNTGRVYGRTGIHLHFEVVANGVKKNPLAFY